MITVNITKGNTPTSVNEPDYVEVYGGALIAYEIYDLGGIRWKFPTKMIEDLIEARADCIKTQIPTALLESIFEREERAKNG